MSDQKKILDEEINMTKKVEPLRRRLSGDGKWEVENITGHWIQCETKEDAELISNAPIVRAKIYKNIFPNNKLADELEKTAEILKRYRISDYRFFRAMSEKARRKIS